MRLRLQIHRRGAGAIVSAALAISLLALITGAGAASTGQPQRVPFKAAAHVNIHEFAFHPGKLTVNRGAKVVFANGDGTAHTATSRGNFATGRIRPGHSAAVVFKQSGAFPYHCSIHNFMHGKIVVR
jgi:plastocyanin